jgi:phage terminase large subunit-like protein
LSKDLEDYLNEVDYNYLLTDYVPSKFALEFVTFIKLVNGVEGEEHGSPVIHYDMIDQITTGRQNLFVSFRGSAKTTALHEYMILYLATYGRIPGFGEVDVGMYISDTIDNGVKSMRTNLQYRWNNSDFLKMYVPITRFTDVRWEFENIEGKKLCFRGFGASTGVRGFKEYGKRPTWCGYDDLMSDKNAESATITRDIKHIIYKAARQALHPSKRMQIWTGTPFNKSDPLYEATTHGSWNVRVYPICEVFPCEKKDFRGAWETRFPFEFVESEYNSLKESGELSSFDQELMLRITSDEDRLIQDHDLVWFERKLVMQNQGSYNFYITTDLATTDQAKSDFSVIGVWAYSSNHDWMLVDGVCKRQLMDQSIKDLFRLVSMYKPLSVGIEINGQQGGFIQWIKEQMLIRKVFFSFAGRKGVEGIRRTRPKIEYLKTFLPVIKTKKLWLPEEMRDSDLVVEILEEARYVTTEKFKSKHDDAFDMVTMLQELEVFAPSEEVATDYVEDEQGTFAFSSSNPDEDLYKSSLIF